MAPPRLSFGILLPTRAVIIFRKNGIDLAPVFRLAEMAEEHGYDAVWVGDSITAKPRLDPMTTLAALAMRTRRVKLGTAVLLAPLRHPVPLAHQLATLDLISGGRLVLGIGVGVAGMEIYDKEFAACGVDRRTRASRFDEMLELLRLLWTQTNVSYSGTHFTLTDVTVEPKPAQAGGIPLWVSSNLVERGLRRVARYGDAWMTTASTADIYRQCWEVIAAAARERGRDPESLPQSIYFTCTLGSDQQAVHDEGVTFMESYYHAPFPFLEKAIACRFGTPDFVARSIQEYMDAGARVFAVRFAAHDQVGQLEIFTKEVWPRFRGQ